jgi:tRNA (adenine22-N1)-methyltransferase
MKTHGLDGLDSAGRDTPILAGMGGETILGILDRAPWARGFIDRFILQPQTKSDALTAGLFTLGYCIVDASLVRDDGRIYLVLLVRAGRPREAPLRILLRKRDALLPAYLDRLAARKQRTVEGLKQSAGNTTEELKQQMETYEEFIRLREETKKWPR